MILGASSSNEHCSFYIVHVFCNQMHVVEAKQLKFVQYSNSPTLQGICSPHIHLTKDS